jgi:outer membrane protein assembly factor BamB
LGNLTAFDAKKGDVDWRLESVGISEVNLDSRGKLYLSTTTAGPDQIRPSQNIVVNNRILPVIMKVEPSTGAVVWQVERLGDRTYLSGEFLYATRAQVSGVDVFASISNNDDNGAPIHHRIYRLDPSKGKELWEYYKTQVPSLIEPKGNRILLQYKNEIQMLKFFSL